MKGQELCNPKRDRGSGNMELQMWENPLNSRRVEIIREKGDWGHLQQIRQMQNSSAR